MFLSGDRAGDEHTEMPCLRVDAVDDGLIVGDQVVFRSVDLGDPTERLRRRTDVVAPGTENDDRRSNTLQVDDFTRRQSDATGCELVTDKQLLGDELDFLAVEQRVASPPFLEQQETLGFSVYFGPHIVELGPEGVGWIQIFEALDKEGTVKDAVADIAGERYEPGPSQHPADVAHRIQAVPAIPIGERRADRHDRPRQVGANCSEAEDGPARLAIADDAGLARMSRMPLGHGFDEGRLRATHVFNRLTFHRIRQEPDEIARMAGRERDSDLAITLHAADAGTMSGTRIDDDEGARCLVDDDTLWWEDTFQAVVDRTRQCPSVQHGLECESENVWHIAADIFEVVVTAPTQHVEHQHIALEGVDQIFAKGLPARGQSPTTLQGPNCCTGRHQAVESVGERQQRPARRARGLCRHAQRASGPIP